MTIEVALLVSFVSVAFSIFFGLKNSKRNDTTDIAQRVKESTEISVKLDGVARNTQEIKDDVSAMRRDISDHQSKIAIIDSSVKALHDRVDDFESRLDKKGV